MIIVSHSCYPGVQCGKGGQDLGTSKWEVMGRKDVGRLGE